MFEAKFEDGSLFRAIIDSIKDIVEHANFEVTPQGMRLRAMDGSHVALVTLFLSYEGFDVYRCDCEQVLGIDVKQLAKFLRFIERGDPLVLQADNQATHLKITQETNKGTVEMAFQLHNLDNEHMDIPEMVYASRIVLGSGRLAKIIKDMRQLDDTLRIRAA